ncbi:unnamed protein product [Pleuronectes platessa]|uniref:Uncharacterized protein n=1 Tax=Pleuronectes platessa TaxID=8262 RepID=A0A9N7TW27_PLEPL|nr:unnamed protein product [Pleuronectes platessa]
MSMFHLTLYPRHHQRTNPTPAPPAGRLIKPPRRFLSLLSVPSVVMAMDWMNVGVVMAVLLTPAAGVDAAEHVLIFSEFCSDSFSVSNDFACAAAQSRLTCLMI